MGGMAIEASVTILTFRVVARRIVDSWLPAFGQVYRHIRDQRATSASPIKTPFVFTLLGNPLMAGGCFETAETEIFLKYIRDAAICIDIGANIGFYTCLAAAQGKHVIAIEPMVANLNFLYRNLINNLFFDVEVFPLGLASKPSIERLVGSDSGASFIPGWAGVSDKRYEIVPVNALDIVINKRFNGQLLVIKMDVEGYENEVLKGAVNTLALSPKPAWLVEICFRENFPSGLNEKFYETFEVFWKNGYQARTANREERIITPRDVSRWVKQGFKDFGSHNYIFITGSIAE